MQPFFLFHLLLISHIFRIFVTRKLGRTTKKKKKANRTYCNLMLYSLCTSTKSFCKCRFCQ